MAIGESLSSFQVSTAEKSIKIKCIRNQNYSTLREKNGAGLLKPHFICPEKRFENEKVLKDVFAKIKKIIGVSDFWQGCQSCFLIAQRNVLEMFSFQVAIFLGLWAKGFRTSKIFQEVDKPAFYDSNRTFWDFEKGEPFHAELADSGEKKTTYCGKNFPLVI